MRRLFERARETLADIFKDTTGKGSAAASVVKRASVEELTFGVVPPVGPR